MPNLDSCRAIAGVVIPAYHAEKTIEPLVREASARVQSVIVVDDGSADETAPRAEAAGAVVLRHARNQGKGAALQTGFSHILASPLRVAITMDADGQHAPEEIDRFLEAYQRTGIPVLLGNRMAHNEQMPSVRRWTNRLMSRLISREMHHYVPDTQCGFRLFHRQVLPFLRTESDRFAAETEMLLHLADRGFRIDFVRVATVYRPELKSHIRPVRDTYQFILMLRHYRRARARLAQLDF